VNQRKTSNIQHPTPNIQSAARLKALGRWMLDIGCWMFLRIVLAALLCVLNSGRAATNDAFARGIELSRTGQFPEAAAAFEESAKTQPAAGTLLDLGLAEWQRGHAGAAIVAWEQARWIDPFDSRVEADLKFARQAAQVDEPPLKWHEAVSTWLPPNAWAWLSSISLWAGVGLLLLPGIFRRRKAGWHQWLAALAFGIFLFSLTANLGVVNRTQVGFVLRKNAPLQLTPTPDGEVISTLAAGEPARKLGTRGKFVFIRTLGGAGWMEQNEFRLVCPP
jgi:tetratricopeptide (TPR) repeat protein